MTPSRVKPESYDQPQQHQGQAVEPAGGEPHARHRYPAVDGQAHANQHQYSEEVAQEQIGIDRGVVARPDGLGQDVTHGVHDLQAPEAHEDEGMGQPGQAVVLPDPALQDAIHEEGFQHGPPGGG